MEIEGLKQSIAQEVDSRREELIELSLRIHQNPELGLREVKASSWLSDYLEKNGFQVERGICQLETAFRGSYGTGKPTVALLAEYDALPQLGHGCGHNIIGVSTIGAAVAARAAIDELGGSVAVIGTPGEEGYGGKVIMAERGAFDGLDAVMIVHPGVLDLVSLEALAAIALEVEFFGQAAHAAVSPHEGINALEAMIQAFNGINSLRQHIKEQARIHGIITKGGEAPNVIPAYSAGSFLVRAADEKYLEQLKEKVLNCFQAAALATGARLEYSWADIYYAPLRVNLALAELFGSNMETLGRKMLPPLGRGFGSSDVGNVSQLVPTIHPQIAIAPLGVVTHSPQFAAAAASEEGHRGLVDGAKAMAMTVVDLIGQPEALARVKEEFLSG